MSLDQLRRIGLRPAATRERVAAGRLHRVHAGVYAVGHPVLALEGRLLAAVLACGPEAFLSHRSAAQLWGLLSNTSAIDVSSPLRTGRLLEGISVHRCGTATPLDVTTRKGIPCANVARTLVDLAGIVSRRTLQRVCEQAEVLELFDLRAIEEVLERNRRRRGSRRLRGVLAEVSPDAGVSRSELERRFLALCRQHHLSSPSVNCWVAVSDDGFAVDFLWPAQRLIAETDGQRFHHTRRAFERDRRRDQLLTTAGYRVVRFTWRQVVNRPREVGATLRDLLGRV